MVKAHFILKQFSYEKGFTDPSSTIHYCKNRFIFLVKIQELYFPEKGCHLGTNRSDNET